jgi:hypothetical protein
MSNETLEISISVQENFDMSFRHIEDGLDVLLSFLVMALIKVENS